MFRGLIKSLQGWRSSFEALEITETLVEPPPLAREWVLWDVERFYGYRTRLPDRMRSAVELFLYRNMFERAVARSMGIAETNPVAMYATAGLTRLLAQARAGELPGCRFEFEVDLRRPVRYRRGRQPRCITVLGARRCNHPMSLHGRERGHCQATGCLCVGWSGPVLLREAA